MNIHFGKTNNASEQMSKRASSSNCDWSYISQCYKSELEAINCCGYCDYRYFYGWKCLNLCFAFVSSVEGNRDALQARVIVCVFAQRERKDIFMYIKKKQWHLIVKVQLAQVAAQFNQAITINIHAHHH